MHHCIIDGDFAQCVFKADFGKRSHQDKHSLQLTDSSFDFRALVDAPGFAAQSFFPLRTHIEWMQRFFF